MNIPTKHREHISKAPHGHMEHMSRWPNEHRRKFLNTHTSSTSTSTPVQITMAKYNMEHGQILNEYWDKYVMECGQILM